MRAAAAGALLVDALRRAATIVAVSV